MLTTDRIKAKALVSALVESFKNNLHDLKDNSYKETQLRNDYLNPLLMALGWDINNELRKSAYKRDVLQEESIDIQGESHKKAPDYTLRANGERKLFVEAKKPKVDISQHQRSAFQVKQYGWSAGLKISVLSNFEYTVIYDCRDKPDDNDDVRVGRYKIYHYEDYVNFFDEISDVISFQAVTAGSIDDYFETTSRYYDSFDNYFLNQINEWRRLLASNILQKNQVSELELNYSVQKIINRLIFLRVCEDRWIEQPETLKGIKGVKELYNLFASYNKKYNSGLFDISVDSVAIQDSLDDGVVKNIIDNLYYPLSPYNFSVVDPSILSQIYERFLGNRIAVVDGAAVMVEESEVTASKGVVPTPEYVVKAVVDSTLESLIEERGAENILDFKIADICCGSGTFLLGVFSYLMERRLANLVETKDFLSSDLVKVGENQYELSLEGKVKILANCIFGVDVNPYAVEVATFSLYIKLLESESSESISSYLRRFKQVLPKLSENIQSGNSLVDENYFNFDGEILNNIASLSNLSPFQWNERYPNVFSNGGFDAIVGNPPFVRIQNLVKYFDDEVKYYKSSFSGYKVAKNNTIDKYYVFLERAKSLINPKGHLCYVVPSKFAILKGGENLRKILKSDLSLRRVLHFGTQQLFPNHLTYTAIFHFSKEPAERFIFKRFKDISIGSLTSDQGYVLYNNADYKSDPWIFLSSETSAVFDKVITRSSAQLGDISNIVVGLQTSADEVYIFSPTSETDDNYKLSLDGSDFFIEKAICKNCIHDLSFDGFDTVIGNRKMIFPYEVINGKAVLISESVLKRTYPNCYGYLLSQRTRLEKRKLQGKSPVWYQFGRSQSLAKFVGVEKLIWPVLSLEPKYILDSNDLLFTGGGNGPYYALLERNGLSIKYILGVLSHPVIELMVKAGASEFQGDYYSHGKQFLEKIPVVVPSSDSEKIIYGQIIVLVEQLLLCRKTVKTASNRNALNTQFKIFRKQLIDKVSELYGLTEQEIHCVERDEAFI
ncbi:Eco57I restriction-modification methylase domain-containing protein [Shewanella xiamenensis]|uniref:Eco57I restriction-modification methylase domain-containing protein n=1 Tax=Shewanella xiamenensis TaxID=332186 RepID=UPI0035BAC8DF